MAPQEFKRSAEALIANIVEMVRRVSRPWPGTASSSVLTKRVRSSPSRSSFPVVDELRDGHRLAGGHRLR